MSGTARTFGSVLAGAAQPATTQAESARVDARLVAPVVLAWLILGIALGQPSALSVVALLSWCVAGCAVVIALGSARATARSTRSGTLLRDLAVLVALIAAATGVLATSAAAHDVVRRPPEITAAAQDHRAVEVRATLLAGSRPSASGRATARPLSIAVTEVTMGGRTLTGLRVPVLLFGGEPRGEIGSAIEVAGTLVAAEPGEPESFVMFARGTAASVDSAPWYLGWANEVRARFLAASTQIGGDGGALLPGLAIGDTTAVDSRLDQAMKVTSLSHLTAVSGANCAIVVGLIMMGGGAIGLSRRWRIACSLLVLLAFVVLVTPDGSVLRASVMAALVLGALASGRPIRGVPVLCLAVVILLANDPWLARNYGFVLSVLATGGLLLLSGPLTTALSRWMPSSLAVLVAIPLAAQLACQPVLILLNPAIPVYGVVANLMSEPAAPAATVIGLVACVALAAFPPLGELITALAWVPSTWIAAVARFFDGLPGAQAPWVPGMLGVGLMAVAVALVIVVAAQRPTAVGRSAAVTSRGRAVTTHRLLTMTLIVCLVGYCGALAGNWLARTMSFPNDWQIAACDVGQGDAVVVRSGGEYALVDTGRDPQLLTGCLETLGVNHLELLVLTHYDLDHVGGTSGILGMVDVAIVGPISDAHDTALRDSLARAGAQVEEVSRGRTGRLGEFRWEVLWPPTRLGSVEPGNPASVTVQFRGVGGCANGCLSSLFLGDLGEQAQMRMMGVANPGAVDVVKVAHHGSADQSETLYARLHALVGVIGVGFDNSYGHPTDHLLDILRRAGTAITRTDLEGMVVLSPHPNGGVEVWTERTPGRDVGRH